MQKPPCGAFCAQPLARSCRGGQTGRLMIFKHELMATSRRDALLTRSPGVHRDNPVGHRHSQGQSNQNDDTRQRSSSIAHTKGQRVVNKRAGRANTLFVAYAPPDEYRVKDERLPWMLLATPGEGVETEHWQDVRDRP